MPDPDMTGTTIIVGIDFGTTFSGVAFARSDKIERIDIITAWDTNQGSTRDAEKTPTTISYDSRDKVAWGDNIPSHVEKAEWFKLLLVDEDDLPDDVRRSTKLQQVKDYLKKHNKPLIVVIAEYLRLLWNHVSQRLFATVRRQTLNFSNFHIVITVPAIWPEYARFRMREAAKEAGILRKPIGGETQLDIISEPEAAALATMADMDGHCDVKVSCTLL
jgi:molecular chaperone DnaK (HSP70)